MKVSSIRKKLKLQICFQGKYAKACMQKLHVESTWDSEKLGPISRVHEITKQRNLIGLDVFNLIQSVDLSRNKNN